MRLPEGLINIAIFGPASVGKSSVSTELSLLLGMQVRHCGEILKTHARFRGVAPAALSSEDHQLVDAETLQIARDGKGLIIEGGFLDAVLQTLKNTIFIHLSCDENQRRERFASKNPEGKTTLAERDKDDKVLKARLYGNIGLPLGTKIELDTTEITAKAAAAEIRNAFSKL